jgi:phosphoserine phosphatase RsbU/P
MQPLTVPGTLDSLDEIGKYVLSAASQAGLERKRAYALRLAVDEIATNIALHGYGEHGLEGAITVRADIDDHSLTIFMEDAAVPYDPTRRPPPTEEELSLPLEERQIGGLGVYLAIQGADKFLYRRIGDRNRNLFIMNRAVHGRLLVADDKEEIRDDLSRMLSRLGYTVTCVGDGNQALQALSTQPFDLALIDVDAPGADALQCLERIKADNALRSIPVLILAPPDRLVQAEQCIKSGAEDYLTPPFHPIVVQARVAACLEKQRVRIAEEALKESEKYERDVQIARGIQLSFLPETLPQPPGFEIAAWFEPARDVAGDFYDAFPLTHDRVALVLGDVCDKGVGAALFMALFRSLIRAFAQQHYSSGLLDLDGPLGTGSGSGQSQSFRRRALPTIGALPLRNAVELTNNYIINNHGNTAMFATLFMAVLDPNTGSLLYINAGHEPPVIFTPGNIRSRLRPSGPAVGMMPDTTFEVQQAQLEPGEMLLVYTDGVTEAKDPDRQLFGERRLLAMLEEPTLTAADLLARIEAGLRTHIAKAAQFDDITMLAVGRAAAGS